MLIEDLIEFDISDLRPIDSPRQRLDALEKFLSDAHPGKRPDLPVIAFIIDQLQQRQIQEKPDRYPMIFWTLTALVLLSILNLAFLYLNPDPLFLSPRLEFQVTVQVVTVLWVGVMAWRSYVSNRLIYSRLIQTLADYYIKWA